MSAAEPFQTPTPAPAAFDNQTNGFTPDQKDFEEDKEAFDETEEVFKKPEIKDEKGCVVREEVEGGLGPVYNSTSCVACHQNAGFVVTPVMTTQKGSDAVSGTSSQVSEIRAGHNEVINNKIFFRDAPGGSVIQQRAIDPRIQERVPVEENIRTLRMATSILGDGFVESIPDLDLIKVRDEQDPDVRGVANIVPVAVDVARDSAGRPILDADGQPKDFVFESRIGRFGWKCQEASLLNFSAGAYVAEMGITSPLQRFENTSLGRAVDNFDPVKDPEDRADFTKTPAVRFGEDVEAFARFMRSTKAPPQAAATEPANVAAGRRIFNEIGCAVCHHPEFTTAPMNTRFGDLILNAALARKTIRPYSDFLLHDIGTGDGIVQTQYAELPPYGLTTSVSAAPGAPSPDILAGGVSITINFERLNALLRGELDPNNRRQSRALSFRERVEPAVQVEGDPAKINRRQFGGLEGLSLRANEAFQMPLLYTTTTAQMIRTAPLWGLRTRPQLLHDGRALTLIDAIEAHHNQAEKSRLRFDARPDAEKQQLLDFLNFL